MKPSIDEQIEAVEMVLAEHRADTRQQELEAALSTLRWVKHKTKPVLDKVLEEFSGATVKQREEE